MPVVSDRHPRRRPDPTPVTGQRPTKQALRRGPVERGVDPCGAPRKVRRRRPGAGRPVLAGSRRPPPRRTGPGAPAGHRSPAPLRGKAGGGGDARDGARPGTGSGQCPRGRGSADRGHGRSGSGRRLPETRAGGPERPDRASQPAQQAAQPVGVHRKTGSGTRRRRRLRVPDPAAPHLRGGPTLLFLFAKWCGDRKAMAPVLARIQKRYADRGLRACELSRYYDEAPHGEGTGRQHLGGRLFGTGDDARHPELGLDGALWRIQHAHVRVRRSSRHCPRLYADPAHDVRAGAPPGTHPQLAADVRPGPPTDLRAPGRRFASNRRSVPRARPQTAARRGEAPGTAPAAWLPPALLWRLRLPRSGRGGPTRRH